MADAMKLVPVEQMEEAGFSFGLYSTHGHPAGTWGFTSPFGFSAKGFAREEQAWDDARLVFLREQKIAQGYLASPPARQEAPDEGAGEREEIARIIDPAAFLFTHDELMKGDPSQFNALSKADRILAALRNRTSEPEAGAVAWLHTLHMELEQTDERVTRFPDSPFGRPGRDYSEEYRVSSAPLYAHPAPATADKLPDDVRRLVLAARAVAFGDVYPGGAEILALDKASEAFADRVPWDGEPFAALDEGGKG